MITSIFGVGPKLGAAVWSHTSSTCWESPFGNPAGGGARTWRPAALRLTRTSCPERILKPQPHRAAAYVRDRAAALPLGRLAPLVVEVEGAPLDLGVALRPRLHCRLLLAARTFRRPARHLDGDDDESDDDHEQHRVLDHLSK